MSLVAAQMRIGEFNPSEELNKSFKDAEDFDLITLLIDLYFPRLKPIFESLRRKNQDFVFASQVSPAAIFVRSVILS
jgi:hypothetical protein